jgi:hypothetical protein
MVTITLPPTTAYAWCMCTTDNVTKLVHTSKFTMCVHPEDVVHITLFKQHPTEPKRFVNAGTVIARRSKAHLSVSSITPVLQTTYLLPALSTRMESDQIEFSVRFVDICPELATTCKNVISLQTGSHHDVNVFRAVDWDLPFVMPGWCGVRYITKPPPGWQHRWQWQIHQAMCRCGGLTMKTFERLSDSLKVAVACLALTGSGYLNGYEHEIIDDRSMPWSALGTGKDCDDFATATVAMFYALLQHNIRDPITAVLFATFDRAYLVSGFARPGLRGPLHGIGHMWCLLGKRGSTKYVDLETTAPILCTTSIGSIPANPRVIRAGYDNEYLTIATIHTHDQTYKIHPVTGGLACITPAKLPQLVYDIMFDAAHTPVTISDVPTTTYPVANIYNDRITPGATEDTTPVATYSVVYDGIPGAVNNVHYIPIRECQAVKDLESTSDSAAAPAQVRWFDLLDRLPAVSSSSAITTTDRTTSNS